MGCSYLIIRKSPQDSGGWAVREEPTGMITIKKATEARHTNAAFGQQ